MHSSPPARKESRPEVAHAHGYPVSFRVCDEPVSLAIVSAMRTTLTRRIVAVIGLAGMAAVTVDFVIGLAIAGVLIPLALLTHKNRPSSDDDDSLTL